MKNEDFDRACRFLDTLAAAMQRYGVSSYMKESLLERVARSLRLKGAFLSTPSQVQSILWNEDESDQRLHITVSSAGDYDLTKLSQISELAQQVESGDVSPDVGVDRLRTIDGTASEYGPWQDAMAFVLCGIGFGVILGISWVDVFLGGALSLMSFGLSRLAIWSGGLTVALELIVAIAASFVATVLCLLFSGSNAAAVAVCAIIYFVPGFGLTLGVSELMTGSTLSGMIGFMRSAVTSAKLFVGVLIGTVVVPYLVTIPPPNLHAGVPHAWTWVFVPVLILGLAILFRVRRKDLVWPVLGGLLAWLGVEAGSGLGLWQGTFAGAFLLTTASGFFARRSGLPAAIILLPAVMVLVPGVAALRALDAAQTKGIIEGLHSAYDVIILIAAILGGLLFGDTILAINWAAIGAAILRRPDRKRQ